MKSTRLLSLVAAAALLAGCADPMHSTALNDPKISGQVTAEQVCSNCHGLRGVSLSSNFPNLAAQQPAYLTAELKSLRAKHRADPEGYVYMWGIARDLTDKQIDELAAYFAAQKPAPEPAQAAYDTALGRKLFTEGAPARGIPACQGCHGPKGLGQGPFPRLAGQHYDYVIRELRVLNQSADHRPLGTVMNGVAHLLTPEEMRSAAAYVETM